MPLQELLNDPNFQTVVVPLFMALISVALVWCLGQIPAVQKQAKRWRLFKLAVESSVLGFIGKLFPDAMATFKSDTATAKVIGLLYALALVGVLVMMVADVVQLFSKPSTLTAAEMDEVRWQDNRQTLMDKVRVKWIDGVLNKSLYQQARIAVGLEERPEMVGVEWQTMGEEKQVLPPGTRLLDRFANLGGGGTLLVLGEPGAGKTTLLLELAQDLLEATDFRELKQPIPIVLNLSAWGTQQFPEDGTLAFTQWLLEELWQQYQVRKEVGQIWLEKETWTLLLDGLDEVKSQHRNACVEALNQFRQKFGNIEIVLCCRIVDYQKLNTHLEGFQAAVYVQPLTKEQVDEYLKQGGGALVGIAAALEADSSLRDLTHTPLFLWILTLAYRNRPAQELLNLPENKRRTLLFNRYIERMFAQRPLSSEEEQQQMLRWLQGIAKKTGSGKEFLIERMQPNDWLQTTRDQWLYRLIVGLIVGLIYGLIVGLIRGLIRGLKVDIPDRTFPNQGMWGSLKTMVITVIVSLVFTIMLYFSLVNVLPLFLEPSLVRGIISAVIGLPIFLAIIEGGGFACIQHFSMRLVLFQTKQIPWNFVTFFKQAEDRLFIYRTGGSYVFVHRYLQEHFANLSFDET